MTIISASYKPANNVDRPIYFLQTDSRWKNISYTVNNDKTQTIGTSGCGPTSAAMIINQWIDKSYGPVEACAWSQKSGYRTANSGTSWGMFKALAVKYKLQFKQTAYFSTASSWLNNNPNSFVVCIMKKGNWTTSGHYILMYKCDGKYVYINDPASLAMNRQKNTIALLMSQCRQYFCFAASNEQVASWADKFETDISSTKMAVSAGMVYARKQPTTSNGDNVIGAFLEGALVTATKKCGDWYYVTGTGHKNTTVNGWCPANCLEDARLDNINSDVATLTKEAVDYMVEIGVINTPDHWYEIAFDLNYLTSLLIAIYNAFLKYNITECNNKNTFTKVNDAIDFLVNKGVISSGDYWKSNVHKIKYLDTLICKVTNCLS